MGQSFAGHSSSSVASDVVSERDSVRSTLKPDGAAHLDVSAGLEPSAASAAVREEHGEPAALRALGHAPTDELRHRLALGQLVVVLILDGDIRLRSLRVRLRRARNATSP